MKTRKSLLAEKLTLEQAIHAIEAKAQNKTIIKNLDGTVSLQIPIAPTDIKQMASLRSNLAQTELRLGKSKSSARVIANPSSSQSMDLLTEQMLAGRWHCSTSRLQRWRAANTGPNYLKIGGKVLYRREDISAYEDAHVVKTFVKV